MLDSQNWEERRDSNLKKDTKVIVGPPGTRSTARNNRDMLVA
jgi:hypothetical protein